MLWQVLQVIDSAFPTGGFAHSAGLEAAVQCGQVRSLPELRQFVRLHLWNTGVGALPFVAAAHDDPEELGKLDDTLDAMLMNHVANRASRTQGRAFYRTCEEVFEGGPVADVSRRARETRSRSHFAPAFGACLGLLGAGRREALALYLYVSLRGVISAAVRMGALGPLEAQRIQVAESGWLDTVVARCEGMPPEAAAVVTPVLDILGAKHDDLYSRLFQS